MNARMLLLSAFALLAFGLLFHWQGGKMLADKSPVMNASPSGAVTKATVHTSKSDVSTNQNGKLELSPNSRKSLLVRSTSKAETGFELKKLHPEHQILPGVTVCGEVLNIRLASADSSIIIGNNQVVWQKKF